MLEGSITPDPMNHTRTFHAIRTVMSGSPIDTINTWGRRKIRISNCLLWHLLATKQTHRDGITQLSNRRRDIRRLPVEETVTLGVLCILSPFRLTPKGGVWYRAKLGIVPRFHWSHNFQIGLNRRQNRAQPLYKGRRERPKLKMSRYPGSLSYND